MGSPLISQIASPLVFRALEQLSIHWAGCIHEHGDTPTGTEDKAVKKMDKNSCHHKNYIVN